ncbi:BON domain-containing protein [Bacteroides sp. 519]|uniref:BON domain-containing protein n=1 Tax=Bacteroides sp. 519 TaxID=2302937 RepID=UPI0013D6C3C4|nr:BON domain-containing protein [Bacteroides sp. 519]NDV59784.1 BON domain-containing protein [Bacteroides sp. 519]
MKKVIFIMLSVFFAGITLQSCSDNDTKIKQEVEKALKAQYSNVSVAIKDKVVTLTGVLENQAERTLAENVVKAIPGIKSVVNNITVQEPTPTVKVDVDANIRTAIENLYKTSNYTDVKVAVANGEVVLSGNVKRADLQKVMQIANEAEGVKKVTNNMTVK